MTVSDYRYWEVEFARVAINWWLKLTFLQRCEYLQTLRKAGRPSEDFLPGAAYQYYLQHLNG